jgi:cytochrome c-type biogenesis protein CcmH
MFYLGGTLLGLIAAAFVCWPLLRRRKLQRSTHHDQVVRDLYRNRLVELEGETQDTALRAEIRTELGAVLLTEELPAADAAAGADGLATEHQAGVWLLAVLIPVCALFLYMAVADPGLAKIRGAEEVLTLSVEDGAALESWALKLDQRTSQALDDSKSWYLLGHTYLKLGRYADAAEAFATTVQLTGDNDLNLQVYWLQARYMAAQGVLDEVSRSLAAKVLEQQPGMSVVLEMLAVDAFRGGDAEKSISLLNQAVAGSADIRQQASFAMAISQVRKSLTEPPPGVTVAVSAAEEVPPHATVFIIARPPGGGMPYAVVKRPAFLVPLEVRLDDLVSMSAARKLSAAQAYEVVVRLSLSGAAMAHPGDWQWQSAVLHPATNEISLLDAVLTPP